MGRFDDAAQAFANSLRLNGETVPRLAGLGEALIAATDGQKVPPAARKAFERVVQLDPQRVDARFWIAFGMEQDGDKAGARLGYETILRGTPAEAPWRKPVSERLAAVGGDPASIPPSGGPQPGAQPAPSPAGAPTAGATEAPARGPSQQDMAAAAQMSPEQRSEMIKSMVEGLAARLEADGRDGSGWQRLIRAYMVLGQSDKAKEALTRARKALAGDTAALAEVERLAGDLGLGS
jgi:cytochrome c-type biogenesis protein CcmH